MTGFLIKSIGRNATVRERANRSDALVTLAFPPYLSSNAATPGRVSPARNSSVAPPPVEMCEILPSSPAWLTAATESPPPTIEVAPFSVASATA